MTVYIYYIYRDMNNYKQGAAVELTAPLTPDQITALFAACDESEYFIPEQVDLEPLQMRFGGIDPDSDHPWHELGNGYGELEQTDRPYDDVVATTTPDALVAAFTRAAAEGWKSMEYDPTGRTAR